MKYAAIFMVLLLIASLVGVGYLYLTTNVTVQAVGVTAVEASTQPALFEELARQVMDSDDVVDELFDRVKGDLAALLREDAAHSGSALDMLMIAKYFERIGDHAVNIAEWVVYSVSGLYKGEELQ